MKAIFKYFWVWILVIVVFFSSWLTHVIHCINQEQWGFLIAGAIAFPIAIIHGFYLWLIWLWGLVVSFF